ncbi:uncharacterized protein LOC141594480 [Silene latifolia]|uniref:uncharacterized protein LOC141594480 n=1 Tax=Silene latifolia TaxID=37657 RepID=UPI003D76C4A5
MKKHVKRDRISELPEEIKEQILSSLCMKDAICTSSLSSVWRHTWVSRPSLDFGFYVYDQFTSYFKTLPTSHPKKRHLYCSIFHKAAVEEEEVDDTVDDFDIDYWSSGSGSGSDSDKEWEISKVGYLQMLEEFMQVYIEKNQSLRVLKKMSLYVPKFCNSKMRDYGVDIVSRCLSLVKHNVTELHYQNYTYGWPHRPKESYRVLQNCFPILESKTLTKLELSGCYLDMEKTVDVAIHLPNLKHLRLLRFNVRGNMLETLFAKCPALETLNFSLCKGFKVLRIPRLSKLKEVKVMDIYDLHLVEINAMSLQCLTLINFNTSKCKLKMASNSCNNLVNLFVDYCGITDDFFNNVAEFPHLETVSLKHCPELKHIKITGNSLTSLDIEECPNLSQAEVVTPKPFFTGYSSSSKNIIKRLFPKS